VEREVRLAEYAGMWVVIWDQKSSCTGRAPRRTKSEEAPRSDTLPALGAVDPDVVLVAPVMAYRGFRSGGLRFCLISIEQPLGALRLFVHLEIDERGCWRQSAPVLGSLVPG
jgi:hypothetical protein